MFTVFSVFITTICSAYKSLPGKQTVKGRACFLRKKYVLTDTMMT